MIGLVMEVTERIYVLEYRSAWLPTNDKRVEASRRWSNVLLKVENLSVHYGAQFRLSVMSAEVSREVVSLIGANGAE